MCYHNAAVVHRTALSGDSRVTTEYQELDLFYLEMDLTTWLMQKMMIEELHRDAM